MISNEEYDFVDAERCEYRARALKAEAGLEMVCGSCHPCDNWRDATWMTATRRHPYPHEVDELEARLAAVVALCDEFSDAFDGEPYWPDWVRAAATGETDGN